MIKAGCFDEMGYKRRALMEIYERAMDALASERKRNIQGQVSLFDAFAPETKPAHIELPDVDEYPARAKLQMEKEMTGVYITGHPLSEYAEAVDALPNHIWEILQAVEEGRSMDCLLYTATLPDLVQEAIVTSDSGSLSQWKDGRIAVLPCSMRTAWELEKQSILGKPLPAYTWLPLSGFSGHLQWAGVVEQTDTARMDAAARLLAFYLQKGSQQKLSAIWSCLLYTS